MRALILIPLLTLAAPALALGQSQARTAAQMGAEFKATDTNGDGVLSRAEVQARVGAMKAGKARLPAATATRLASMWFARADANKDGRVTRPEADALLTTTFRQYDTDGDGRVTPAERAAARAAMVNETKAGSR